MAFEPMVFEMQGGVEPRCAAILHRIAAAVATVEDADLHMIKSAMLQRIAILIARGNARAIKRRDVSRSASFHPSIASARLLSEAAVLEEENQ